MNALLQDILVSAAFVSLELFVLAKWIEHRETISNAIAWAPFRKMMLDAVVHHCDELMAISSRFNEQLDTKLENIKKIRTLHPVDIDELNSIISHAFENIDDSKLRFFNIIQTVAPSLQPYAASYCNEVLWFSSATTESLRKAKTIIDDFRSLDISDNLETSPPLSGLWAMGVQVRMYREFRFANFKENFTASVWKKEGLHYHERSGEFLEPGDYAAALEADRGAAQLKHVPRTVPIRSFFDS